MFHHVVWKKSADVSEMLPVPIRAMSHSSQTRDDGDSKHLWNVGQFVPNYLEPLKYEILWALIVFLND
jgi:hypothetical protein